MIQNYTEAEVLSVKNQYVEELESFNAAGEDLTSRQLDAWRLKVTQFNERSLLNAIELAHSLSIEHFCWLDCFQNLIKKHRGAVRQAEKAYSMAADEPAKQAAFEDLDKRRNFFKSLLSQGVAYYQNLARKLCRKYRLKHVSTILRTLKLNVPPPPFNRRHEKWSPEIKELALLSCHRCILQTGDLYRYMETESGKVQKSWQTCITHYKQAIQIVPGRGNPFNQLGTVQLFCNDYFSALYYFCRSVAVDQPYMAGEDNIKKALVKFHDRTDIFRKGFKLPENQMLEKLLLALVIIHKQIVQGSFTTQPFPQDTHTWATILQSSLLSDLASTSILKMMVINFAGLKYYPKDKFPKENSVMSLIFLQMLLASVSALQHGLQRTHCLPLLRVMFQWIICNKDDWVAIQSEYADLVTHIWETFVININPFDDSFVNQSSDENLKDGIFKTASSYVFAEDVELNGFSHLEEIHKHFNWHSKSIAGGEQELGEKLRDMLRWAYNITKIEGSGLYFHPMRRKFSAVPVDVHQAYSPMPTEWESDLQVQDGAMNVVDVEEEVILFTGRQKVGNHGQMSDMRDPLNEYQGSATMHQNMYPVDSHNYLGDNGASFPSTWGSTAPPYMTSLQMTPWDQFKLNNAEAQENFNPFDRAVGVASFDTFAPVAEPALANTQGRPTGSSPFHSANVKDAFTPQPDYENVPSNLASTLFAFPGLGQPSFGNPNISSAFGQDLPSMSAPQKAPSPLIYPNGQQQGMGTPGVIGRPPGFQAQTGNKPTDTIGSSLFASAFGPANWLNDISRPMPESHEQNPGE